MIETVRLSKTFGANKALSDISLQINEGEITGLVGTNGAGKSTLLRIIAGILRPDSGQVSVDGKAVYDNPEAKRNFFFVPDEPYFFTNANGLSMAAYYESIYPTFDMDRFRKLSEAFSLPVKSRISTYSKGMKRQLSILLAVSSGTKYIMLDETFDGLDPVMRTAVKSLFAEEMSERGLTPFISSHSLRELEDICDHVGLLHKGGLLLSESLDDMKTGLLKLQCVFSDEGDISTVKESLHIMADERQGMLHVMTVKADRAKALEVFSHIDTVFFEILPLSLEELFIAETEDNGYDVRKLIIQ